MLGSRDSISRRRTQAAALHHRHSIASSSGPSVPSEPGRTPGAPSPRNLCYILAPKHSGGGGGGFPWISCPQCAPSFLQSCPVPSCLHAHTKQHHCSMTSKHLAPVPPQHFGAQRKHKITLTFLSFQRLKSLPCESVAFSTLACGSVTAGGEERPERAV